ncbi:hypothetical protein HDA41_006305 [Streptomyces caelestis]|uniref:Uncharacterized protein n=1 Tax=Streptomyces caelestis TaxID=36816 RepID=A0A7W9LW44_9ACTN|nr:hypothetical protein [Streptomyces caelestis]
MRLGRQRLLQARIQLIEIDAPLGCRIPQLLDHCFPVVVRGAELS